MSATVTIGSASATIHGTFQGALDYVAFMTGDAATTFLALAADDQKRALVSARRLLDRQHWGASYLTFAARDMVTGIVEGSYELAVLVSDDGDLMNQADTGSNIQSLQAGSAAISFFNPTTRGADPLPAAVMALVGVYLAQAELAETGPESKSSCADNPLSAASDMDRERPW